MRCHRRARSYGIIAHSRVTLARSPVILANALALATVGLGVPLAPSVSDAAVAGELSHSWMWPVDAPHLVVREYQAPLTEYGRGHRGLDIAVADGDPVRSPATGHVLFAGEVAGLPVLTIDHGNDVVSTLQPVRTSISVGKPVASGEVVGVIEFPAVAWDDAHVCSCLHIGARYLGDYVSPRVLLGSARPSILKPWGNGPGG